jgi:hypothetical protein
VRVAITFRDQPEHERRGDEQGYSSLGWREAKSLSHFVELKTPALFNHEVTSASSRNCRAGFPTCASRIRRDACIAAQRARRNIRASNENPSRTCENLCCI